MIQWLGIHKSKFHRWVHRYGKANEHNGQIPRDNWTTQEEQIAIIEFFKENPLNGYRRLCFMMIDQNVAFVSPGTVYNILKNAGLMGKRDTKPSSKGKGFVQPGRPHRHWHVDISYINICGTFFYLCSVLDGYSRYIVHWDLKESMKEADVELVIEKARERYPGFNPRIISDNGPQFVAKDFKEYVRLCGMTHVKTSPYYPQSNGKIERWHQELKKECIRPQQINSLKEGRQAITDFVDHYNAVRLHSGICYVTPLCKLEGKEQAVFVERDRKLELARERRAVARATQRAMQETTTTVPSKSGESCYNDDVLVEDKAMLGSNLSAIGNQRDSMLLLQ